MNKDQKQLFKRAKADERESRRLQGYFDGRYAPKSIPDKKKQSSLTACRRHKHNHHETN